MATDGGESLGPPPTTGSGPRRTRRLRLSLSTEYDPVVLQFGQADACGNSAV